MSNIVMKEANKMMRQKRLRKIVVAAIVLLLVTAFASYFTTAVFWDGAFPSGEYHLQIVNQSGNPIKGATLNIYQGKNLAFEYPFDNYLSENSLVSNDKGEIVLTHLPRGLEFGGSGWLLFWVIPINMSSPKFNCEVIATEYKPLRFSANEIFVIAYETNNTQKKTVHINGYEVELEIFEKTIILKGK